MRFIWVTARCTFFYFVPAEISYLLTLDLLTVLSVYFRSTLYSRHSLALSVLDKNKK